MKKKCDHRLLFFYCCCCLFGFTYIHTCRERERDTTYNINVHVHTHTKKICMKKINTYFLNRKYHGFHWIGMRCKFDLCSYVIYGFFIEIYWSWALFARKKRRALFFSYFYWKAIFSAFFHSNVNCVYFLCVKRLGFLLLFIIIKQFW